MMRQTDSKPIYPIFFALVLFSQYSLALGKCYPSGPGEPSYAVRGILPPDLRKQGYDSIIEAVQVHTTPESRNKWSNTVETIGGKPLKGEQLDDFIDIATTNDYRILNRQQMKSKGYSRFAIDKQESDVEWYLSILMQKRLNIISRGFDGIIVYRNYHEHNTALLAQSDHGYCEMFQMATYHYREQRNPIDRPEWISPKSNLAKIIGKYRKERGFWLAFYGKADTGETVAIMGKQHFSIDNNLLPFHFNGVIIVAKDNGAEIVYTRDLIKFIPNHETIYE